MENRPQGREKHVTGQGKDVYKRGEAVGGGPVGSQDGHAGRSGGSSGDRSAPPTRGGGGGKLLILVVIIAAAAIFGGGNLLGLFGGSDVDTLPAGAQSAVTQQPSSAVAQAPSGGGLVSGLGSLLGGSFGSVSTGWTNEQNTGRLNTAVAAGAREKYTNILGNGDDTVTIMVYMCGTDLESKYGMGTADLQEMAAAALSEKVNVIAFTGGCKQWKNNVVSSSVNQIYKVENGGLKLLEADAGTAAMTSPANLAGFIRYCAEHYPANRACLIFWDHGGGSLSGYGYDEKNSSAGSMGLSGIDAALKAAGMTFDFIGFDACLMATLENALMLTPYADYLIASEETEPGVGWYYTDWLTKLSANTSMSTLEIGKNIIDDFVTVCGQKCSGQATTLSIVDLAEIGATVPESFKTFATATSALVQSEYQTVSSARGGAREFAASSKIDQVDLVDFSYRLGTDEGAALARTLLSAVKYNRTSGAMTNAYGLSIYFPYQKTNRVNNAVSTYNAIGLDSEYGRCIEQFASLETGGQAVSGAASATASNPLAALSGLTGGGIAGSDMVSSVLSGLLSSALSGRSIDTERAVQYLSENQFDSGRLVWTGDAPAITLPEEQWTLVNDLELNVFLDDGAGYIDLGLDNVFAFTDDGALLGEYDGTWLAIDAQPVAYYHTGTVTDSSGYIITGYVPVLLNGERAQLLLVFDSANPYGYIAGARSDYRDGETETIAKGVTELQEGDAIDFLCDYYAYDGTYQDSYRLGEPWTYHADAEISNVYINADAASATYRFTDLYNQQYWTAPIP